MERKTSQDLGDHPTGDLGEPTESLVEMVLSEQAEQNVAQEVARIEGVVIGMLTEVGPGAEPFVDFVGNAEGRSIQARATVAVESAAIGREVALMFEGGDPRRPIILGLIHQPGRSVVATKQTPIEGFDVQADGERMVLSAKQELVIRCGKASITLTSAGKVLIRGAYLLARSSGVNCIQGGSVQIN
jgi:hypothetical protein